MIGSAMASAFAFRFSGADTARTPPAMIDMLPMPVHAMTMV